MLLIRGRGRTDVDEDKRDVSGFQFVKQAFFQTERHDGDAFDAPLNHPPDGKREPLGIVDGGSGQNFVVVLDGDVLEFLNDFREKTDS